MWINCHNVFDASLPFGGYKQSGWGREMGEEVFHNYTEVKAVARRPVIEQDEAGIVVRSAVAVSHGMNAGGADRLVWHADAHPDRAFAVIARPET